MAVCVLLHADLLYLALTSPDQVLPLSHVTPCVYPALAVAQGQEGNSRSLHPDLNSHYVETLCVPALGPGGVWFTSAANQSSCGIM